MSYRFGTCPPHTCKGQFLRINIYFYLYRYLSLYVYISHWFYSLENLTNITRLINATGLAGSVRLSCLASKSMAYSQSALMVQRLLIVLGWQWGVIQLVNSALQISEARAKERKEGNYEEVHAKINNSTKQRKYIIFKNRALQVPRIIERSIPGKLGLNVAVFVQSASCLITLHLIELNVPEF